MSRPSDDLSALFRSLRPDEAIFQESTLSKVRSAEQRWPLLKDLAPQKPQDTPALSEQERQRWTSQEKPAVSARKPALSLPGLNDTLSKNLGRMSGQVVQDTAAVHPAAQQEPDGHVAENSLEQPSERARTLLTETVLPINTPANNTPANNTPAHSMSTVPTTVTKVLSAVPAVGNSSDEDVLNKKPAPMVVPLPVSPAPEHHFSVAKRGDESLKSIFSRLEAKPEVEVKIAVKRSSFLDRLGKR